MGISKKFKDVVDAFSEDEVDRLIRMGWEDRTPFDAIEMQFGLSQNLFIRFMRSRLDDHTFKRWRKRANQRGHLKQGELRTPGITRFKCSRQSLDGKTKGWK